MCPEPRQKKKPKPRTCFRRLATECWRNCEGDSTAAAPFPLPLPEKTESRCGRLAWSRKGSVNGYCSICIRFPTGRRVEIRARKWKHMGRVSRIRGAATHKGRAEEKGNGNLCEEIDWINSLQWAAPCYPIIYTAWEPGNPGHGVLEAVSFRLQKKWHSAPRANQ